MKKRFLSFVLALIMCFGAIPSAFAAEIIPEEIKNLPESTEVMTDVMPRAGSEVWNKMNAYVGKFTMEGNNLTPVKTVGLEKDSLNIVIDSFKCSKPVYLTVQIRKAYSSQVYAQATLGPSTSGGNRYFGTYIPKGTQIQISFRVTDVNGNYDDNLECTIEYSYMYI